MKPLFPASLLLMSSIAISACVSMPSQTDTALTDGWSNRAAFYFGDIDLDFVRGLESGPHGPSKPLIDCSTEALFCARGDLLRVVVPRSCADLAGASGWSTAGVSTVIVGRETEPLSPHGVGSGDRLLLADPARPEILYEYDWKVGLLSIYFDPGEKIDFVSMARSGELADYRTARMAVRPYRNYRHFLSTREPFGRCLEKTSDRL